jgi:hypothetical protein
MIQQMNKYNNLALGSAWAMLPTLGGLLAILALGKYQYLLVSAATGFLSFGMLENSRSKRILAACVAMSVAVGVVCHLTSLRPDGNITGIGIALLLFPAMAINIYFVLRIYLIEAAA